MNKIVVMVCNVGKNPTLMEIENDLNSLQSIVEGHIEMVRLPYKEEIILICNEEGKLLELAPQLELGNDVICGNFLLVRDKMDGDITSLNSEDIDYIQTTFGFTL